MCIFLWYNIVFVVKEKYESTWKIFVDQPGEMIVDASFSFQGEKPSGSIKITATKA